MPVDVEAAVGGRDDRLRPLEDQGDPALRGEPGGQAGAVGLTSWW